MTNAMADGPAREAAPIDRGLTTLGSAFSDLREEVRALIVDIDPILAREFEEAGQKDPQPSEVSPNSTVANVIFSIREDISKLTMEVHRARQRVEV